MISKMKAAIKILAIIPARGGSKRLPGKNIRILGDKPLISWSIDVAKSITSICDVLVSTDASDIALIAQKAGALVPWIRPEELSTDTATSVDVVLHALNWYEGIHGEVDGVILLQPTSPFRTADTIKSGIDLFFSQNRRPVVGLSRALSHPMWMLKIENDTATPFISIDGFRLRSQDLPPAYIVNGCFYMISPNDLRVRNSFFSDDIVPLLIESPKESIDIDTEFDFMVAQAFINTASNRA
jgi:CMP-N,N'-diacetyllegionaminic acid synthase